MRCCQTLASTAVPLGPNNLCHCHGPGLNSLLGLRNLLLKRLQPILTCREHCVECVPVGRQACIWLESVGLEPSKNSSFGFWGGSAIKNRHFWLLGRFNHQRTACLPPWGGSTTKKLHCWLLGRFMVCLSVCLSTSYSAASRPRRLTLPRHAADPVL